MVVGELVVLWPIRRLRAAVRKVPAKRLRDGSRTASPASASGRVSKAVVRRL